MKGKKNQRKATSVIRYVVKELTVRESIHYIIALEACTLVIVFTLG